MRNLCLWLGLALVLLVPNALIARQEALLAAGTSMIVELAPVDPRSLMQGDYMRLAYGVPATDGVVHVDQDERGVVTSFEGKGAALRVEGGTIPGAQNYFFEEGQAAHFQTAVYAELKVTEDGRAMLTGLLDEDLKKL